MAKHNKDVLNILSYCSLIILAVLIFVRNFLPYIGINLGGVLINALGTIQSVFTIIVIGINAYNFTVGNKKGYAIAFWIALVVYIASTLFVWF